MSPDVLARLAREAEAPEGIAVRVSGPEMKRLLEERVKALRATAVLLSAWRAGTRSVDVMQARDAAVAALALADAP